MKRGVWVLTGAGGAGDVMHRLEFCPGTTGLSRERPGREHVLPGRLQGAGRGHTWIWGRAES